jgi:excisionase family DNA binding protein
MCLPPARRVSQFIDMATNRTKVEPETIRLLLPAHKSLRGVARALGVPAGTVLALASNHKIKSANPGGRPAKFSADELEAAMGRTDSVTSAAHLLGCSRQAIYHRLSHNSSMVSKLVVSNL